MAVMYGEKLNMAMIRDIHIMGVREREKKNIVHAIIRAGRSSYHSKQGGGEKEYGNNKRRE